MKKHFVALIIPIICALAFVPSLAGATALSDLTAATASNTINNGANGQVWQWNALTGTGLTFSSNTTVGLGSHNLLNVSLTGANSSSNIASFAAEIFNVHSGTNSTNYALYASAANGTANNYGIVGNTTGTNAGDVGIWGYADGGSGASYGVYGTNTSATGYAGYFSNSNGGYAGAFMGGDVGIGTATPQNLLDVNGAASIGYNVAAPTNGLIVNGNVGIGTTSPSHVLDVEQTNTATSGTVGPVDYESLNVSPAGTSTAIYFGGENYLNVATNQNLTGTGTTYYQTAQAAYNALYNNGTGTLAAGVGAVNLANNNTTGTITTSFGSLNRSINAATGALGTAYGSFNIVNNLSTGPITTAYGTLSRVGNSSTGTYTTAYSLQADLINAFGTVTTWYGLYVPLGTATTKYPLYIADTGNSYFAGNVGIGTTIPNSKLQIFGGEVQVGSSSASCSATNAGALRYASGSAYVCDGSTWDLFGGSSGGTLPALTSANIWVGNASNVATAAAMSGDCTISNTAVVTCTKTNGTSFGTLATQFGVNLSSQATGTLQAAQFPALTGDVSTTAGSLSATVSAIQGTTVSGTTGTGKAVLSVSPTVTGTVTGVNSDWSGNVAVGTATPTSPLTVNGVIESQTGGVKFPDGTTQTTAASSGGFSSCTQVSGTGTASCAAGYTMTGGGCQIPAAFSNSMEQSYPSGSTTWTCQYTSGSGIGNGTAYAICCH